LQWLRRWHPELHARWHAALRAHLVAWGGNASGVNVANIDNLGNVHPDTFWWDYTLGNVKTRPFSAIWRDTSDPLMAGLKQAPRAVKGRCARCAYFDICGGNTRVRAWQVARDAWAEDPGCYLDDDALGIAPGGERLVPKPYIRLRRAEAAAEVTNVKASS
jgi:radical SAM protein with 4Fe4S-binding SPASM domain